MKKRYEYIEQVWRKDTDNPQVECYQRAIKLDQYLAVAYFQQGVSNFLMGDFEEALANFNDTLLYLRGNTYIDYEQLGLKFKLYSCEVLFNRGLCYIYLQQEKPGMQDFGFAQKEKMTQDHDVIDDAIRERAVGYTVFSIPVGMVYRPNEAKVKNLKTKDYLGKARLIATSNSQNTTTGFTGADRQERLRTEMAARDDRPPENISYAATNLVQRNLSSRGTRDQSAPPVMNRNVFPPTPPPEAEKPVSRTSTGSNSGSSGERNLPLRTFSMRNSERTMRPPPSRIKTEEPSRPGMLGRSATFEQYAQPARPTEYTRENSWPQQPQYDNPPPMEKPRLGTIRTASEPRGPPSRQQYIPTHTPSRSTSTRTPLMAPGPLFGEQSRMPPPVRNRFARDPAEDTIDNVYDMYQQAKREHQLGRQQTLPPQQTYIIDEAEEDEYIDDTEVTAEELAAFEPVSLNTRTPPPQSSTQRISGRSSASKRVVMSKIRVKVHSESTDDTRYMMMGADSRGAFDFGEFESKLREKFGVKGVLKIKMRDVDDGDMITMGDQDDLEMLLGSVRTQAKREAREMGKCEVWISY